MCEDRLVCRFNGAKVGVRREERGGMQRVGGEAEGWKGGERLGVEWGDSRQRKLKLCLKSRGSSGAHHSE